MNENMNEINYIAMNINGSDLLSLKKKKVDFSEKHMKNILYIKDIEDVISHLTNKIAKYFNVSEDRIYIYIRLMEVLILYFIYLY